MDERDALSATEAEVRAAVVEQLVKSKQRVADHGEVFTPAWLVEDMLDLVLAESERIDSRFLEPACGEGAFLVPVLRRKLATVHVKYRRSDFDKRHHALLALMSAYGIELLADNVEVCRQNLLDTFAAYLGQSAPDEWFAAARVVVEANIVHGNALEMKTAAGEPILFAEWAYLGRGRFSRRDFSYKTMTQMSSWDEGTLFHTSASERAGKAHELFTARRMYPAMNVIQIGSTWTDQTT